MGRGKKPANSRGEEAEASFTVLLHITFTGHFLECTHCKLRIILWLSIGFVLRMSSFAKNFTDSCSLRDKAAELQRLILTAATVYFGMCIVYSAVGSQDNISKNSSTTQSTSLRQLTMPKRVSWTFHVSNSLQMNVDNENESCLSCVRMVLLSTVLNSGE